MGKLDKTVKFLDIVSNTAEIISALISGLSLLIVLLVAILIEEYCLAMICGAILLLLIICCLYVIKQRGRDC